MRKFGCSEHCVHTGAMLALYVAYFVKIQQPVNYQYLHKYGQQYWRQPENTQNPKHKETSTNVEATLFTTNKEGTCAM